MRNLFKSAVGLLVASVTLWSCGSSSSVTATRSLRGSGDVTFLCASIASNTEVFAAYVGRPLEACPDYVASQDQSGQVTASTDGETREMLALVTQVETGEIALVRMANCQAGGGCTGRVVDSEPTQPGVNFMAVGAEPGSIVSTPGGIASFVGVAEPGKEGIYGIPTTCIGPRQNADGSEASDRGSPIRDITTWPACRLPAAPGEIEVIFAPEDDARCGRGGGEVELTSEQRAARECPADLSMEQNDGRHKLAVAMPSLGQLAIVDAQALLDRAPGSFSDCPVDAIVDLGGIAESEAPTQAVPPDMSLVKSGGGTCDIGGNRYPEPLGSHRSTPSDIAPHANLLYVADETAPVVHVLDAESACDIKQLPPLLPTNFLQPDALVTTRRVAVSPITPSGKQFVYAVDNSPGAAAGSVMVFDVTQGTTQRTPLVRPRSSYINSEPPDRIAFDEEISDITFAYQDLPVVDPETGVAVEGLLCDPDPRASLSSPAVQHRPGGTATDAGPPKLRGVFGFVALHSGLLAVIDVEDLDAPCRRPARVNSGSSEDFRGCKNDPFDSLLALENNVATVTDEFSCNIIEPHRARPVSLFNASSLGNAPRLRGFPQLRDEDGSSLSVDQTEQGRARPRLLAAAFTEEPSDAEVRVGATNYLTTNVVDQLVLDPGLAERNSVLLPFLEPRAYTGGTVLNSVTFEGAVRGLSDAPFVVTRATELPEVEGLDPELDYGVFVGGSDSRYCASGIEDGTLTTDRARTQFAGEVDESEIRKFRAQYSDYVNVTGELLQSKHHYWDEGGKTCGADFRGAKNSLTGREVCSLFFGTPDLPDPHREFRIIRGFNNKLVVEPRFAGSAEEREAALDLLQCCFPRLVEFEIRASNQWIRRVGGNFEHDVRANRETLACERNCNPQTAARTGRVFEISCDGECEVAASAVGAAGRVIGPSNYNSLLDSDEEEGEIEPLTDQPPSMVCVLDTHPNGGLRVAGPAEHCIQNSLTARFGVFRGLQPSQRGMQFSWRTEGGFGVLAVNLLRAGSGGNTSSPRRIEFLPNVNRLVVADGGSIGLEIINLRSSNGTNAFGGFSPVF